MPETELEVPPFPAILVPGYSYAEAKVLEVRCHDQLLEDAIMTDETGAEIFRAKSEYGKSWSLRRSVYNAAGQHVLDFRHYSLDVKNRWIIEDPAAKKLGSIEHVHFFTRSHSNVDLTILGEGGKNKFVLEMRQKDHAGITTFLNLQGSAVAEISMVERNRPSLVNNEGRDRSAWKIRVAPTVDLSIVMVMALCRAEMAHVWEQ